MQEDGMNRRKVQISEAFFTRSEVFFNDYCIPSSYYDPTMKQELNIYAG